MNNFTIEAKLDLFVDLELPDDRVEEFFDELIEKFHEQYDGVSIEVEKVDFNQW